MDGEAIYVHVKINKKKKKLVEIINETGTMREETIHRSYVQF